MVIRRASRATGEEKGTALGDGVAAELAELRHSIDKLTQGLTQLVDTGATHTEMLRHLMAAVTTPTKPENEIAVVLQAIVARLTDQGVMLRILDETMTQLPEAVGAAVSSQFAAALAAVP